MSHPLLLSLSGYQNPTMLPSKTERTLAAISKAPSTTKTTTTMKSSKEVLTSNHNSSSHKTVENVVVNPKASTETALNDDTDVITAPPPEPPTFSKPVDPHAVEEALSKVKTAQEMDPEPPKEPSHQWDKRNEPDIVKRRTVNTLLGEYANEDKEAFLADRNRVKARRREAANDERTDHDDTLWEMPTKMPEVDYSFFKDTNTTVSSTV